MKEIQAIWEDKNAKAEELAEKLEHWCEKVKNLQVASLGIFAQKLRMSTIKP